MTSLSTHVLDIASGRPSEGMNVVLLHGSRVLFNGLTDVDGRCPALRNVQVGSGAYCLRFSVAAYFRTKGHHVPEPPFLDVVQVDFGMSEHGHYHVPLLVSPYGYSTYRGS